MKIFENSVKPRKESVRRFLVESIKLSAVDPALPGNSIQVARYNGVDTVWEAVDPLSPLDRYVENVKQETEWCQFVKFTKFEDVGDFIEEQVIEIAMTEDVREVLGKPFECIERLNSEVSGLRQKVAALQDLLDGWLEYHNGLQRKKWWQRLWYLFAGIPSTHHR